MPNHQIPGIDSPAVLISVDAAITQYEHMSSAEYRANTLVPSAGESRCLMDGARVGLASAQEVIARINMAKTDFEVEQVEFGFKDEGSSPNLGLGYWLADQSLKGVGTLGALAVAPISAMGLSDSKNYGWLKDRACWFGVASASVAAVSYFAGAVAARRLTSLKQHRSRQEQFAKQVILRLKADLDAAGNKYTAASLEKRTLKFFELDPSVTLVPTPDPR
jgi:hypothetical protein